MRQIEVVVGTVCAVMIVLAVIASVWLFGSITGTQDGTRIASDRAAAMAEAIERDLGYRGEALDTETIAAGLVFTSRAGVTPVEWSGSTEVGDEASIDVRIRVEVEGSAGGFGNGPVVSEGSAERCYRFALAITQYAQRAEVDCTALPTTADPPAAPTLATLPEDAGPRLDALLLASDAAEPGTLTELVRAEFPDPAFSIDTGTTDGGELVVALGAAESRNCIVRVRRADGTVAPVSFDRIQLEPGEGGCRVELYTAPAL